MNDLRFALRSLAKSPGFTVTAVLTLALGVGLNASMFSLINGMFLRPLAYPQSDQLVRVYRTAPRTQTGAHTVANYLDLARESDGSIRLATFRLWNFTLAEPGHPARMLNGLRVSADFFPVLGLRPELGRFFTAEEDRLGAKPAVILSHRLWQAEFGGDPTIVGREVRLDGQPTTVVGVMPATFAALTVFGPTEAWCPVRFTTEEQRNRIDAKLEVFGRCAPGVTPAQAEARLRTLAAQLEREHPAENNEQSIRLQSLRSAGAVGAVDTFRQMSWFTQGLAACVLLITCANLANLQLGRALRRSREYAVRAALGASRRRLMQPILCEGLLIGLGACFVGLLVCLWANDWIFARLSQQQQLQELDLSLDVRVLAFAAAASLATGLLFALVPAWLISRLRVNEQLKSGGRSTTGGPIFARLRDALIIGQFALALVLLAGAGFFHRGVSQLLARDPGWQPAGVLQGVVTLPAARYPGQAQILEFYRRALESLAALPGVQHVAVAWALPIFNYPAPRGVLVAGRATPPVGLEPIAYVNGVTPSFLDTLGLTLVAGRAFAETDDARAPDVVLINESLARTLFPGESPIGRRLRTPDAKPKPTWCEIVGVVRDVRLAANLGAPATPFQVYRPLAQDTWGYATIALRSTVAPATLVDPFRRAIAGLDADLPIQGLSPASDEIEEIVSNFTRGADLLAALALLGLFLAALGIFGVITNVVAQRTPELGVRIALGAPVRGILWLVLGSGLRLALLGIALGLAGAFVLARLLRQVAPALPAQSFGTAATVAVLLTVVALVACWLPARRATRIDPVEALRAE